MFKNGWYTLEEAEDKKINALCTELQSDLDNLN